MTAGQPWAWSSSIRGFGSGLRETSPLIGPGVTNGLKWSTCPCLLPKALHTDGMDVLIVVATAGEARRLADLPARTVVCGVGPVSAALATQQALHRGPRPELVVSAGIGGAFVGAGLPGTALTATGLIGTTLAPGMAAVASRMVYGDLGAWDGETFLGFTELGLSVLPGAENPGFFPAWEGSRALASRLGLACGTFVTVSATTGSVPRAGALLARFPGALVEGMEGAGVAQAAALHGVACTEIRGVSNLVGPRDRPSWQIGAALEALHAALAGLLHGLDGPPEPRPGPVNSERADSAPVDSQPVDSDL